MKLFKVKSYLVFMASFHYVGVVDESEVHAYYAYSSYIHNYHARTIYDI